MLVKDLDMSFFNTSIGITVDNKTVLVSCKRRTIHRHFTDAQIRNSKLEKIISNFIQDIKITCNDFDYVMMPQMFCSWIVLDYGEYYVKYNVKDTWETLPIFTNYKVLLKYLKNNTNFHTTVLKQRMYVHHDNYNR